MANVNAGAGEAIARPRLEAELAVQRRSGAWTHAVTAFARQALRKSIVIIAFLALWEIAPRAGFVDRTFFPPLSNVLDAWWQMLLSGDLAAHTEASLKRSIGGFLLAVVISVPVGLAIGWWKPVAAYLNPLLEVMRNTAPLAILPVFILLLGLGEPSKISIVFYACFFPLLLNTISGVKNVDPLLIKSARSMGLSSLALFRKVIVPAALPTIFVGIRQSGAASILVLVAAEMVGAKEGLGYLIQYAQFSFQIPQMYAGILSISVIGLVLNYTLVFIERRLTAWKQTYGE
ncbi:ABC transporter permease [Paenibacillus rhizovicinus]|uniref:ABC transporter permease n=1 Tax=Paenibacillus rhizovicinus TaxID=2704463 RepID=A0A6C0NY14_9BACL|nr:ABC transporter permease [Paenibacillus rhizovicinus]QHW31031.1 ABC transporter permease [Paenibacillus rhizovicinus]